MSGEKILLKLLSSEWIHYPLTLQILAEGNISRTISWLTKYSLFQPPSNFVQYCTNAVQYKKFLPIKSIWVRWTYSMIICINLYSYSRYKSLISNISIRSIIQESVPSYHLQNEWKLCDDDTSSVLHGQGRKR